MAATILRLLALATLVVVAATTTSPVDLHVERIGVPFPSWSAPVYSNATPSNQNPQLTRQTHLAPRFHRLLRYGMDIASKTQTAIFVAGRSGLDEEEGREGASIISALNPRNGETGERWLWRIGQNGALTQPPSLQSGDQFEMTLTQYIACISHRTVSYGLGYLLYDAHDPASHPYAQRPGAAEGVNAPRSHWLSSLDISNAHD